MNAGPWPHRYLHQRHGSISGGFGSLDEAHAEFLLRRKHTPYRIEFGEMIDTWHEPGVQVPVHAENGRVLWYRWDPIATPQCRQVPRCRTT